MTEDVPSALRVEAFLARIKVATNELLFVATVEVTADVEVVTADVDVVVAEVLVVAPVEFDAVELDELFVPGLPPPPPQAAKTDTKINTAENRKNFISSPSRSQKRIQKLSRSGAVADHFRRDKDQGFGLICYF